MTFGLLFFALPHYVFLLFLAATAFAFGARLTRRIVFPSRFERFVISSIVGLGALGVATFLLGLLRLLYAPQLALMMILVVAAGYADMRDLVSSAAQKLRETRWWVIALVAAVALAGSQLLLLPLYPPTQWDSTSYHLAVAGIYAREHAVVFTPYLRSPVFPQLNELLFTLALMLYDDLAAQLIQLLLLLLTTATMYCWARRSSSRPSAGLWAGALWISSPLVMMLGTTGYVEIALTCFLTAAAYAFIVWLQRNERSWLLLSAALFGFAEGVKYIALFPIMVAGLVLLYQATRKEVSPGRFRDVFAFTAVLIAVAGPWHARIAWHTGNPIWPYGASIFGPGPWPLEHIQSLFRDQFNRGAGTDLGAAAMLPWNLTFNAEKYFAGELVFTPVILYLLPVALLAAIWNGHARAQLSIVVLYTTFWFYTAQNARYLVHALPLLCLACGIGLAEIVSSARRLRDSALLAALGCLAIAAPGFRLAKQPSASGWIGIPSEWPPRTAERRAAYIAYRVPEYAAVDYLNHALDRPYTLYSFPSSNLAAYVNGTFVGDWYGPARYEDYLAALDNPEKLYQFFLRHGVQYLLVSQSNGGSGVHSDQTLAAKFLCGHLKLIYAEDSLLYEVLPSSLQIEDTPELIQNNELDERDTQDAPRHWVIHGRPRLDTSGKESLLGTTTVGTNVGGWLEQTVPVSPEARYAYRALVRPTVPDQYGVFTVDWLDSSGEIIKTSKRYIAGPVDWLARATAFTAPRRAVKARLRAASTEDETMWFDYFSFRQILYKEN